MTIKQNDQLNWDRLVKSQVAIWEVKQKIQKRRLSSGPKSVLSKSVITISRTHGAGGDNIAAEIASLLKWQIYDRELVEYIAQTCQIRNRIVECFDERKLNQTHNWVHTLLDKQVLGMEKYFRLLHDVIVAIAEQGQAIIIGRGSNFIVEPQNSLRVMITAPMNWRVNNIAEAQNITAKEAKKVVALVDSNRYAFVDRYFHRSANDMTAYDLVLNVEHLSSTVAAKMIINNLEIKLQASKARQMNERLVV
ncbi:cytidylate kinase-like family protein [candidate division KSB1 bacterium]|nr:cytidylate kinase-like family protein [candidate division KSB1 bacterium]